MSRRHESLIPLSHDHREALGLAFRLHNPSPPGPATALTPPSTAAGRAAEVLDFFTAHLDGHFRAEEEVLFPTIASHVARSAVPDERTRLLLRDLVVEHREMERLRDAIAAAVALSAAEGASPDAGAKAGALEARLGELADVLERHVRREERELFVRFASIVPDAEATAIEAPMRAILDARPPRSCRLG